MSGAEALQALQVDRFIGWLIVPLRLPQAFRQAIDHPVLRPMHVSCSLRQLPMNGRDSGWTIGGNLLTYGQVKAHV